MALLTRKTPSLTSDYNARFRDIIEAEFPGLEGRQDPQVMVVCDGGDYTHGDKAIKLAKSFGVNLMPWQRVQVRYALAVDELGMWLHSDYVLICPRQNGKSLILEVIMLYRLFKLNHQIVFSAHQWRTAKSIRNRMWKRIKSRQWALKHLVRNTASAGEAEMETAAGGKIQFTTRSNDMGRGFDKIDLLMIDEAYNLDSGELDAVSPTQLASEDPQTFFTSSAVNQEKHPKGEELSKIRHRAQEDDAEGIMFSEFAAPEGLDPDSPETWKLGNPSYGIVATEKKVRSQHTKLSASGFAVEMLGWGNWFSVFVEGAVDTLVDLSLWGDRATTPPVAQGANALGVDVSPDGDRAGMVAAIRSGDKFFLSLNPITGFDRDVIVGAVKRTIERNPGNDPVAVAMDPSGQCSTLVPPLGDAGVEPESLNGSQVSKAYELFMRLWTEGRIIHDGDPRWVAAWEVAEERSKQGKFRSFERYSGDVTVLVAASFAMWALQEFAPVSPLGAVKSDRVVIRGAPMGVVSRRGAGQLVVSGGRRPGQWE